MSIPSGKVTVSLSPSVFLGVYNDDLRKDPTCAPLDKGVTVDWYRPGRSDGTPQGRWERKMAKVGRLRSRVESSSVVLYYEATVPQTPRERP